MTRFKGKFHVFFKIEEYRVTNITPINLQNKLGLKVEVMKKKIQSLLGKTRPNFAYLLNIDILQPKLCYYTDLITY